MVVGVASNQSGTILGGLENPILNTRVDLESLDDNFICNISYFYNCSKNVVKR